ncbi:tyrosine recombinase XerS [Lentilactobacillus diolivorans]|uniref:Site-specific tyrosine recombinase XerS n=2 Tax=Lentilactobacillus diolivorans TaxID=179838 RepID=A0A0R1S5V8_9LACO|nr:tyrosine recombinase XerS [Lentilactobacillus diolivorans]KRL64678.1 site-specific tyrosine recombinase XerS [Lentilactobacillus diolivorans DSM 14421]GEP22752.1 tyrosine recombinase XerS [Lentilactobacillus diolivorans]
MKKSSYIANNETLIQEMPNYVQDYYLEKSTIPLSPATLYQYLNEFHRFFAWMIETGVTNASTMAMISLTDLEKFRKQDMELYKAFLLNRGKQTAKNPQGTLSHRTVNRSLNALSALFRYLTEESENADGEPYFYRNVMKKIALVPDSETYQTRARNIKDKLMLGNADVHYLDFILNDYPKQIKGKRVHKMYERDRQRDVAINALMLGTGIRVSELVNANVKDINLTKATVSVQRKGGKRDSVPIANWVMPYIEPYLAIRKQHYHATKVTPALFLTKGADQPRRISTATVELLVAKYSQAFNHVRITPHKLRHTLASKLYLETNNEHLVATQLGQSSTKATGLYTHIVDTTQKKALDDLHKEDHK